MYFHAIPRVLEVTCLTTGSVSLAPMAVVGGIAVLSRGNAQGCGWETRSTRRWFFKDKESIAVFFKGADTFFYVRSALGPRVTQCDLFHGTTVTGAWITVVSHLTTLCLCIDQVAVTRLVGSIRWLLIKKRLITYFVAGASARNNNVVSPSSRHSDNLALDKGTREAVSKSMCCGTCCLSCQALASDFLQDLHDANKKHAMVGW